MIPKRISLQQFINNPVNNNNKQEYKLDGVRAARENYRNPSAYTLLNTKGRPVKDFICNNDHITKLNYKVYYRGTFVVSRHQSLLFLDKERLDMIVDKKIIVEDVYVYEGKVDPAIHIHRLFFNEDTRPITKCHSYWFGLDYMNNILYFCALQGDSIKICEG